MHLVRVVPGQHRDGAGTCRARTDHYVDIIEFFEQKAAAVRAHASQVGSPFQTRRPETAYSLCSSSPVDDVVQRMQRHLPRVAIQVLAACARLMERIDIGPE